MVPLLAAASAVSTMSDIASGAQSLWKSLSASGHAGSKKATESDPGSFAALLGTKGVDTGANIHHGTSSLGSSANLAAGAVKGLVNRLA